MSDKTKASKPAPKEAAASEKEEAAKPIVAFKLKDLENMKRDRLISLCKRAGIKANQTSQVLKDALTQYYEANTEAIEEKLKAPKRR